MGRCGLREGEARGRRKRLSRIDVVHSKEVFPCVLSHV